MRRVYWTRSNQKRVVKKRSGESWPTVAAVKMWMLQHGEEGFYCSVPFYFDTASGWCGSWSCAFAFEPFEGALIIVDEWREG